MTTNSRGRSLNESMPIPGTCIRKISCPRCQLDVLYLYTEGVERNFVWNRDCPNCRIRIADPVPRHHESTFSGGNNHGNGK